MQGRQGFVGFQPDESYIFKLAYSSSSKHLTGLAGQSEPQEWSQHGAQAKRAFEEHPHHCLAPDEKAQAQSSPQQQAAHRTSAKK